MRAGHGNDGKSFQLSAATRCGHAPSFYHYRALYLHIVYIYTHIVDRYTIYIALKNMVLEVQGSAGK